MEDLFLGAAVIGIVIFGFYLMKRLDCFMKRHYKSRRIVPDPNESGVVIFNRPNARPKEKQDGEAAGSDDGPDSRDVHDQGGRPKNMQTRVWNYNQGGRSMLPVEVAGALCYDNRRS